MSVSTTDFGNNNSDWDLSAWDSLRDEHSNDDKAGREETGHNETGDIPVPVSTSLPQAPSYQDEHPVNAGPDATETAHSQVTRVPLPPLTLKDLPATDTQARDYFAQHGADSVDTAFVLANILHTNRHVSEAAIVYRRACDLHSRSVSQFPSRQTLLQVSLLCRLKAGQDIPEHELAELRSLNIPFANYIEGTADAWKKGANIHQALEKIGNAYDEFHTGEEADWIILESALHASPSLFEPSEGQGPYHRIPNTVYMYWDKNPPPEVAANFDLHRNLKEFKTRFFDKEEAAEWLYQNYGVEARSVFLNARHPAEEADFLRVHIIQALGGWWLDADIRLKSPETLNFMASRTAGSTFFLTQNHVVHNDFFGSVANSDVLSDCLLSLYRNCYLHQSLYIAYKTGPGVFNRALNRIAHRSMMGCRPAHKIEIHNFHVFNDMIAEFDTPYKHQLPSWQAV